MKFRKLLFWLHLTAGVVAGVVILVMAFTGAALAFEKDLIAWAERDVRQVTPHSSEATRLSLDDLLAAVREKEPDARPSSVTVDADPKAAVLVSFGRTNSFYANPYTGEIRQQGATGLREFMRVMIDWHRWLGGQGDNRVRGKAITGACNAAFLVLAMTGLYLWFPRKWSGDALRGIALFNFKLRGKARDWNWHNVIGLWCAPVLIVLTATALPISYRWAGDLIYKLTRSEPPPAGAGPGGGGASVVEIPPGAKPLEFQALFAAASQHVPAWDQVTLRIG
ncbi:MAG TPA: PepSY-associated TM helix domain-containing protein, partial [Verrucomicrobiae bacterium]|nr:PepSY-associated TM helix domain-containing protein [Verrucomicrobiae bacterium]